MKYSFRKLQAKILESFDYFEYLNSISFHPPVMIITTLVFFYIRRKILLEEIRNEYKKISRKNSEGNIKKK